MTSTIELTAQQGKLLAFIVRFWGEHMMPPTIREMCAGLGIRSPNGVVCHLRALAKKGAIVWTPGEALSRSIVVPQLLEAAKRAAAEFLKPTSTKETR